MAEESSLYYRYYDFQHQGKDYAGEIDIILTLFRDLAGTDLVKVLDVGCGTGSHSLELAKRGYHVLGVDIDRQIVQISQGKQSQASRGLLNFFSGKVEEVAENGFDLAISLFNVVNYVLNIQDLHTFFAAIRQRVREGGLFVFDLINGVAAMRDPARRKESEMEGKAGDRLKVVLTPHTDLMNETLTLKGQVEVSEQGKNYFYEYSLSHRLWTPKVLGEMLTTVGFEVIQIIRWMQPGSPATADDWKIMFLCRRSMGK